MKRNETKLNEIKKVTQLCEIGAAETFEIHLQMDVDHL